MIESNTKIGTGALRDAARTERVKRAMGWQVVRYSACNTHLCRDCRFGQFQNRREFVCALASIKTLRTAKCGMFAPGETRLYVEADAPALLDRATLPLEGMAWRG